MTKMTAEEYRQRMIQAFHNADCDELIAICVLPTEKEFEHLEWLLEKHYKAKPESKIGQWIYCYTNGFGRQILKCSKCGFKGDTLGFNYCPNCGQPKMQEAQND